MKVLNLQCEHQHGFEGWFASEDDAQRQLAEGLVECPMCGSSAVRRLPSAPRLNLSGATSRRAQHTPAEDMRAADAPRGDAKPAEPAARGLVPAAQTRAPTAWLPSEDPSRRELETAWLALARELVARTDDVGNRFAEEARRIHYGEAPERGIRGQATPEETRELLEEGVPVMPLPMPAALKGPVH